MYFFQIIESQTIYKIKFYNSFILTIPIEQINKRIKWGNHMDRVIGNVSFAPNILEK